MPPAIKRPKLIGLVEERDQQAADPGGDGAAQQQYTHQAGKHGAERPAFA
jgi:hypothetical protein